VRVEGKVKPNGYRIPIIFISAHSDGQIRAQAMNAGAVDFLFKPFSEDALVEAVHAALSTPALVKRFSILTKYLPAHTKVL
jgi:FixJ family two-component response regulator